MPLIQMPNGEYVNIAEGTPPEVVARIKAQYSKKPSSMSAISKQFGNDPISDRNLEVSRIVEERRRRRYGNAPKTQFGKTYQDAAWQSDVVRDKLASSFTLGLTDLAQAGVPAVVSAFKGKNLREQYNLQKDAIEQERAIVAGEHPFLMGAADITGALISPVGAKTGLYEAASKIAPKFMSKLAASGVGKFASKVGESAIGLGARAGINQGAITGAINSIGTPETALSNIGNEALIGGLAGGAAAGAITGIGKLGQIVGDRLPQNANRVAYEKIADMLDRSRNPSTGNPYTPLTAINEIQSAVKAGNDPMLMDLTPEMQDIGAYMAHKPKFSLGGEMALRSENRAENVADRFNAKVESVMKGSTTPDAFTRLKQLAEQRKQVAEKGFTDDIMKQDFVWNEQLQQFFTKNNPLVKNALKRAEQHVLSEDIDPKQLGFEYDENGDIKLIKVPNMFVFDKIRKGFNSAIGEALRAGDKETARAYSMQLSKLKTELGNLNPDYMDTLKSIRDLYQKEESVDLGLSLIKRIKENPRQLIEDMRAAGIKKEELRIGVTDVLLRMHEKAENPIKVMRSIMRSKDQRKVLQYVFNGNSVLNDFDRFMRREIRARETDQMVSSRVRRVENLLKDPPDIDAVQGVADVGKSALQGGAFGGAPGAVSRALRSIDILSRGMGPQAQEELARILMGRGEGLKKGVDSAKKYSQLREKRIKRNAEIAGKGFGGLVTGNVRE